MDRLQGRVQQARRVADEAQRDADALQARADAAQRDADRSRGTASDLAAQAARQERLRPAVLNAQGQLTGRILNTSA